MLGLLQLALLCLLLLISLQTASSFQVQQTKHTFKSTRSTLVMMPSLLIQTSVQLPQGDSRQKLLKEMSATVATGLKKPEEYVLISLKHSDAIMFAGDATKPAAYCYLASIGNIQPATNQRLSQAICDLLNKHLGVDTDRIYIQFYDSQASNWGYDGSTF